MRPKKDHPITLAFNIIVAVGIAFVTLNGLAMITVN